MSISRTGIGSDSAAVKTKYRSTGSSSDNSSVRTNARKAAAKVESGGKLNNTQGNKDTQAPTNTSINKEAVNFWVQRGDGKKVAVDIYGQVKGADALNSGGDGDGGGFANTFNLGLDKAFGGNFSKIMGKAGNLMGKVQQLTTIASSVKSAFSGNGNFLDKIGSIGGLSKTVLSQLNIPVDSDLYKKITAGTNIVVKVSETSRKLQNVDWSNIQSVAGVISEYTKDNQLFKITDLGAKGAFVSTLINEAVKNGIPNSFESLVKTVNDSTLLKSVIGDILPTTIKMSDLGNLKGIIDFVGGKEMQNLFPGIIEDFSKQYKRNWWDDKDDDTKRYKEFRSVATTLNKDWYKTDRGTKKILSVEKVINGNDTFMKMIKQGIETTDSLQDERKLLALATVIKPTTVRNELSRHFPRTVIASNNVTVPQGNNDLLRA